MNNSTITLNPFLTTALVLFVTCFSPAQEAIDRQALVARHHVTVQAADPLNRLQVGNGEFAFTADVTGLQGLYGNIQSQWGWHTQPLPAGMSLSDFTYENFDFHGRQVGYATSSKGQEPRFNWLRENPHRICLGRLSLCGGGPEGKAVTARDLSEIHQELDLWRGLIISRYQLNGQTVEVETCCHPELDAVAVRISSPLLATGWLSVVCEFPYGNPGGNGADWKKPQSHRTEWTRRDAKRIDAVRTMDQDGHQVAIAWGNQATVNTDKPHTARLVAGQGETSLEFLCAFSPTAIGALPSFNDTRRRAAEYWQGFWEHGGAIDLSGSSDKRWNELERRIVLSQYLMAIQAAGSTPPQESCLVNNGWNGKFHLEMHWWHTVHFALWDRWPLMARSLGWYQRILPLAQELARSQGFKGARWPKMVGPDGHDAPSRIGPLLIWQQPHPIYYAELDYRLHPGRETLERWRDIVFSTADFLASFATQDTAHGPYILGPAIKTVPENTDPRKTINPAFELSYWRFGLRTAQTWRERLGLPRDAKWDTVLKGLAPLPVKDGVYLQQEGMDDTYTRMNWEHPSLIGTLGMLPGDGVDPAVMRATVKKVWATWQWDRCWGWDFPMMAMAAARNGEPGIAIEALLYESQKNKNDFTANGFSKGGPYPYFPSNGGLLTAVAMMAAGWDGASAKPSPGFPEGWKVRYEGLRPLP